MSIATDAEKASSSIGTDPFSFVPEHLRLELLAEFDKMDPEAETKFKAGNVGPALIQLRARGKSKLAFEIDRRLPNAFG